MALQINNVLYGKKYTIYVINNGVTYNYNPFKMAIERWDKQHG